MFDQIYNGLNENQKLAVDTIEGPVMVIAGAGTGKTSIIACRIARILKETDLNPSNILCMTFTEAGVTAMRNKVLEIIGPDAYKVRICTFHAFCNEVIMSHPELFPQVNKDAEPISDVEKVRVILDLLNSLEVDSYLKPYSKPDNYLDQCKNLISKLKHEYVHPLEYKNEAEKSLAFYKTTKPVFQEFKKIRYHDVNKQTIIDFFQKITAQGFVDFPFIKSLNENFNELIETELDLEDKETKKVWKNFGKIIRDTYNKNFTDSVIGRQVDFAKIYEGYQNKLLEKQTYDYDDMVMFVVDAFKNNTELLSEYQEQYQYILVDEYQDTNASQNEAVFLLGSFFPNPNIFVVGDDDQSIFKFQGANTQNIFAFKERYDDHIKIITLKDNYRSHQLILDAAADLIDHNETRISKLIDGIDKHLTARKTIETKPIDVMQFLSRDQESMFISKKIKDLIEDDVPPQNIAILCRDNKNVEEIREFLNKFGIPSSRDEGEDIFNSIFVRQLIKLIRFLIDIENNRDLFLILTASFLGLNQNDVIKLNLHAEKLRIDLSELFLSIEDKADELSLKDKEKIIDLSKQILNWRSEIFNTNAVVFFNKIINDSGYTKFILTLPNYVDELGKLSRLFEEIKKQTQKHKEYSMMNFIDDLDLYEKYGINLVDNKTNLIENKVRLSTVHKSKGLEYDVVFLYNCVDKVWSNKASPNKLKLPLAYTTADPSTKDTEEERRLFYVALTRARKHVIITYATSGEKSKLEKQPAQFIQEIPKQHLDIKIDESKDSYIEAQKFVLLNQNKLNISQEVKELVQQSLKDLKLTITHINSYKKCPRCFFYNTILRIPKIKTESQALGTIVHDTLKFVQMAVNQTGVMPSWSDVSSRIHKTIEREFLNKEQFASVLLRSEKLIQKFLDASGEYFMQGDIPEKNMGPYSIVWEGIPIAGKIDLIKLNSADKKVVDVVDFKTGNPDTKGSQLSKSGLGDYYRQLLFYKLLIENTNQLNYKVQRGYIKFIEPSRKDDNDWIERSYDLNGGDYDLLKQMVKDIYAMIQNLEFDECGDKCDNQELHDIKLF